MTNLAAKPVERRVAPYICHPRTKTPLQRHGDVFVSKEGTFPIVAGIPRFVDSDFYVSSFSFEWNIHRRTQLDIYRQDMVSEREFVVKTGLSSEDVAGKLVLDAGVGAGRYTDVISRWGADVVAIDLSYAVEAAYRTLGDRPNVWVAQADISALPFLPGTFDIVFSIGVLHHTPDTRAYFQKLVPLLRPGGVIAIWVYPSEGDYLIRRHWIPFTNKIPKPWFHEWCRWFVPWAHARLDSPGVAAIMRAFPFSTHDVDIEGNILDTFDGYSPRYHGVHSPEEVERWFGEAGLVDVQRPSDRHTSVRGRRPQLME